MDFGRYAEAEAYSRRGIPILEKTLGIDHPDVATDINDLAIECWFQGKYYDVEQLLKRSLDIDRKTLTHNHPDIVRGLGNLARLYYEQGRFGEAEMIIKEAVAIEKTSGPKYPGVSVRLNRLGAIYQHQHKFAQAEFIFKQVIQRDQKYLGLNHYRTAEDLGYLGNLYRQERRFAEARLLFEQAADISEKALGAEHPSVARYIEELASTEQDLGHYAKAKSLFDRALGILEKTLGPDHPSVGNTLGKLALLYRTQGDIPHASQFYERAIKSLSKQLIQRFAYMSERDRLSFLGTVSEIFPSFFSFCATAKDSEPALAGRMYDALLLDKGVVADSIRSLREQIALQDDKDSYALLDQLSRKRAQLAALATVEPRSREEWRKVTSQVEQEANDLEQNLVRRSSATALQAKLAAVSWQDVQKALGPEDAAVEFIQIPAMNNVRIGSTSYYAALVLTSAMDGPILIILGEGVGFEKTLLATYRQAVSTTQADLSNKRLLPSPVEQLSRVYHSIWKPLETALGSARRVYVSPDGILNNISLGILPNSEGTLLLSRYDLHIVASTKDLLRSPKSVISKTAVLAGNPQFYFRTKQQERQSIEAQNIAPELRGSSALPDRSKDLRTGALFPLDETEEEVRSVDSFLKEAGWQTEVYTGDKAAKATILKVRSPRILHIATHGFFLADQKSWVREFGHDVPPGFEDPMLRSGLFLAGAGNTLSQSTHARLDDNGVLTAFEAAQLNLQGTELVVLSACETGLGEVRNGEGTFGLRRALQEAGAASVLMSLWRVRDRETSELMQIFYKEWLSGKEKTEALKEAQLQMRERVIKRYGNDLPFYWGAFVLVSQR